MENPLRSPIEGDADDLASRGVCHLVARYGMTMLVIGEVADFVFADCITGVLRFRDDIVGRTAQEMFLTSNPKPKVTQTIYGCVINF